MTLKELSDHCFFETIQARNVCGEKQNENTHRQSSDHVLLTNKNLKSYNK